MIKFKHEYAYIEGIKTPQNSHRIFQDCVQVEASSTSACTPTGPKSSAASAHTFLPHPLRPVVVRERSRYLLRPHPRRYPSYAHREFGYRNSLDQLARGLAQVRRDHGVVVADGDEEGPDTIVHTFLVSSDVLGMGYIC